MVTALLLSTVPGERTELQCIRTNQKFHHKFSVFECMKIAHWNYAQVSLPLSHTIHEPVLQNINILLEGTFSLEKWKSKWPTLLETCGDVLSKVVKNIIFQNKTLLVMFYRHNVQHFGTNFVILNIFWKQKIVKTKEEIRHVPWSFVARVCHPQWITVPPILLYMVPFKACNLYAYNKLGKQRSLVKRNVLWKIWMSSIHKSSIFH